MWTLPHLVKGIAPRQAHSALVSDTGKCIVARKQRLKEIDLGMLWPRKGEGEFLKTYL